MRKTGIILLLLICSMAAAQDKFVVIKKNGIREAWTIPLIDSITFPGSTIMRIHSWDKSVTDIQLNDIDSLRMVPDQYTPETDRLALIALFNSAGGPEWINKLNWCSEEPLNEWYGITTNQQGRVIALSLGSNQLSGSIPPELGNLSKLEQLFLGRCNLTGTIPPELGKLYNLDWLQLADNKLSGTIPKELGQLVKLRYLGLDNNQLTGTIPADLGFLSNLETLDLSGNQLTGSVPVELSRLLKLINLTLAINNLAGNIPAELGLLSNLEHLNLSSNKFENSIPANLGNLKKLNALYLAVNSLSGTIPPELRQLTSLKDIRLNSNFLTGSIPPELGQLSNLETANLSCNELSGSIPVELGQLRKLTSLDLSFNLYTGEIPREVAILWSLPGLSNLDIKNNRFSGIIPTSLINHQRWNENVWGIIKQQDGYKFEREIVKIISSETTDINGKKIDLDSLFASNNLTIVFKWSDWDPFTGKFLPILKSVYQNYYSKGLGIISYIHTTESNITLIKKYIADNQMNWTNVVFTKETDELASFPEVTVPNVHIVSNQNREVVFSDQLWDAQEDFEQFITSQLGPLNLYESKDYSQDGKITKLQSSSTAKGLNIVLMGDGFVDTAMISGGMYEQRMLEAADHLFSVEPARSYRNYFNVYYVKAVSKNGVFMNRSETVFSSEFGENRGISGNLNKIREYAMKIEGINSAETHIITVLNSTGLAGTNYMYDNGSISLVSAPYDIESFAGVLQHEAIGHGVGRLGDEYIDFYETISQAGRDTLIKIQSKGWYQNLSLSPSTKPWDHFIGKPGYNMVGAYEGGFYYWKGVWRPEESGIMIISRQRYFNGPSREQIVKRIFQAAGITFTWEDFVKNDKIEPKKSVQVSDPGMASDNGSLAPPVFMNKKLFE